jgi:polyketide biosynthesis enoyl-CoA hydratase PksI
MAGRTMSAVAHLTWQGRVAVIELAEREHSNLLTERLLHDLARCIREVRASAEARVMVVHGYDSIFCAGGTQEQLMKIAEGQMSFDDPPFYRMFLDSEIPVIAAMQGHALGGGLALGLFADLVLMAEESLYRASFMQYGFTPGMGTTLLLPMKLGPTLAAEMLFTARGYHGGELQKRGVDIPVLKRKDVIPAALKMASEMAEKPLVALKALKARLADRLRTELPRAIEAEKEMQELTFRQPEVRARIGSLFGQ